MANESDKKYQFSMRDLAGSGSNVMKLDFKNILNVSDDDEETTDEVDEITNDDDDKTVKLRRRGKKQGVDVKQTFNSSAGGVGGEGSFCDRERAELTETFENEKSDIVKGFILEKRILSTEHSKEKKDLISNFVAERQRMLESFQQQVKDIEQKMSSTSGNSKPMTSQQQNSSCLPEKVFDLSVDGKWRNKSNDFSPEAKSVTPGKLLIKVEGDRILTPEQFLSAMELEERFESEKEIIEKSFRKEKHQLKDKLEVEFSRKLLREKEKHERDISALHSEIDKLRNVKHEFSGMWKSQASQLESDLFKEQRSAMERHYCEENNKLRQRLEERNESKLATQQKEYDRMIHDLRGELRQIKKEISSSKNGGGETPKSGSSELRREIETQLRVNYENEMRLVRQQNEKLNNEIQKLTTDKYDLARKLREIEFDKTNESKCLQQHNEKVGKEYAEKMKKVQSQNEKLKLHISQLEKQKEELKTLTNDQQNNIRGIEGRLELTERTIIQYEDTVTGLRRENSNLSHEIHLLRIEKEDLASIIAQYNEQERSIKVDAQRLQHDVEDWRKKGVLMEREKLKAEKSYDLAKNEVDRSKTEIKKSLAKIEAYAKETDRLRNLLEGECAENKRLHARFKTDAELLRKKEGENTCTRTQLDNLKMQFETLKTKIEADNERIFKLEKERQSLQKKLENRKNTGALQDKHQLAKVQTSYCKEFSKRMEYVKANYEREIFNLKERIGELTNVQTQQQQQQQQKIPTKKPAFKPSPPPKQHCQSCKSSAVEYNSQPRRVYFNPGENLDVPTVIQCLNQKIGRNDKGNDARCFPPTEQEIRDLLLTTKQNASLQQNQTISKEAGDEQCGTEKSVLDLFSRVQHAEFTCDNSELRKLLRDVRKEVLMLNKLIDEQTPRTSPQITPRLTPPTKDNAPAPPQINSNNNIIEQMRKANQKALDLQDQLADRETEVNESKETLQRLYCENNELQRRLTLQQDELEERENSCDELYKRRLMLEKLVDRLQGRLRDETTKRRRLEQAKNVIYEVDEENSVELDDSTV